MEVEFADDDLDRLETDRRFDAGVGQSVVKGFRKVLQAIRAAPDENEFYQLRRFNFEKLKGNRSHQHSFRLDKQFRLIVEFAGKGRNRVVRIIEIVDYH